jgi:hypothetical protein
MFTRHPLGARQAADKEALDHGEVVTAFGLYWADYGQYPRSARVCWLDLAPDRPVIRPIQLFGFRRQSIPVQEQILSAQVRPRRHGYDSGIRPWTRREVDVYSLDNGKVVSCRTSGGILRLVVARADAGLMEHYLKRLEVRPVDTG